MTPDEGPRLERIGIEAAKICGGEGRQAALHRQAE